VKVQSSYRSGFTLLELALALVVLTIVALVAIALHFDRPEISLERAARLLAADLRLAQTRAIVDARESSVAFDPQGFGWTPQEPDGDLPPRRLDSDAIFEGVRLAPGSLPAQGLLAFDARGTPSADVALQLEFDGHTLVVIVNRARAVVLDPR
jgi:prepilin-type N-terminal cleavage/methylation domain-containing protein